eukprot:2823419-Pleurochrysis_carterae.AAC.1
MAAGKRPRADHGVGDSLTAEHPKPRHHELVRIAWRINTPSKLICRQHSNQSNLTHGRLKKGFFIPTQHVSVISPVAGASSISIFTI